MEKERERDREFTMGLGSHSYEGWEILGHAVCKLEIRGSGGIIHS